MSSFDDPSRRSRAFAQRLPCGRTLRREHDAANAEEGRLDRVVDAAVVRALFPEDGTLVPPARCGTADGNGRDRQLFPWLRRAMSRCKVAALREEDLKVGFSPHLRTPTSWRTDGFYSKQGLNVEVVKTAGWASPRQALNKETTPRTWLSPMPLAITIGVARRRSPTPCRRSRTSTARPSRSRSAQGQARSKSGG